MSADFVAGLNAQLEKCVQELHHAVDLARELDQRNCLPFDLDDLQDILDSMESLCNKSEGIDDDD